MVVVKIVLLLWNGIIRRGRKNGGRGNVCREVATVLQHHIVLLVDAARAAASCRSCLERLFEASAHLALTPQPLQSQVLATELF